MKIENIDNNSISPLSSKKAEGAYRTDKAQTSNLSQAAESRDKAEVSDNARLLAKARTALDTSNEIENERLAEIRKQIENGDYTVQFGAIAQRLMTGIFSK